MEAEIQILNQEQPMNLKTRSNELMEVVYSFKYLGAWIKCSQTEFKLWKTMAWNTYYRLKEIWRLQLLKSLKLCLFLATVESLLLYGSET